MEQLTSLNFNMKCIIDNSVKEAILKSGLSDIELGERLGVSRTTIYKWRTQEDYKIRTTNVVALADLLTKEVEFIDGYVSFKDKVITEDLKINDSIIIGDTEMELNAGDLISQLQGIIKDLQADKKDLRDRMVTLSDEKIYLTNKIDELGKTIVKLTDKPSMNLNLDHSRMQFIVNTEHQTYINSTQAYAELYNVNAFDIINEFTWKDTISKDDFWRMPIIVANNLDSDDVGNIRNTWKVDGKNGQKDRYFETHAIILDDKGIFKKIDAEKSTKAKWIESNKYYESYNNQERE